jgi:hypothetical protein
MIQKEKIFENFFDDRRIINARFYNFSQDSRQRLDAANGSGDYQDLLDLIDPLILDLGTELGEVDITLNLQKGKTMTNDQVKTAFIHTMRVKKGVIADLFGGEDTVGFVQFYPHGISEYNEATKPQMPTLTNRVKTAALANTGTLPAALVTLLAGFKTSWDTSRADQESEMGIVSTNRDERSAARVALELGMLTVVHTIAAKFPGDVDTCLTFFNFSKLFRNTHMHIESQHGTLTPGVVHMAANLLLNDNDEVVVENMDDNANILVYKANTATAEPEPDSGVLIKTKSKKILKPSAIGDNAKPFLLLKNTSTINDADFRISIRGLEE